MRRSLLSLLAAIAATMVLAVVAAPAQALVDAVCVGDKHYVWSPGLHDAVELHDVTIGASLRCTSLTAPAITGASMAGEVRGLARSCTRLLSPAALTLTLRWNTGETSSIAFRYVPTYADGQLIEVQSGTVVSGKFLGSQIVGLQAFLTDLTACGSPTGITRLDGTWSFNVLL